jgi:hypothetical protein
VASAESPTFGLMIVPTSGPSATPVSARVPATPWRGRSKRARQAAGTCRRSSRTPVASPRSNRLPATVAASVGRLVPMLAVGNDTVTRARRHGPLRPCRSSQAFGRLGAEAASSSSTLSTLARLRWRSASVSPATRTKVPLLCSPASTSATSAGSSGVSSR